jgi:hypothetical protein
MLPRFNEGAKVWRVSNASRYALDRTIRALGAGVADGAEHILDSRDGLVRGNVRGRGLPSDCHGVLPCVWIGAILHPAMLLALANRSGILQHRDCPSAQCPHLGLSFKRRQHGVAPAKTNPSDRPRFPLLAQGRDSGLHRKSELQNPISGGSDLRCITHEIGADIVTVASFACALR